MAQSYFEVFGLPRHLAIDAPALERDFYRLSRELHPDKFAKAGAVDQARSLEASAALNDAYRTLKDPLRRTEYLLRLEGFLSQEEGGEKKEHRAPPDLLEEVFELNMQLDEMRINRRAGEGDPQLERGLLEAKTNFSERLRIADAQLEKLWAEWDAALDAGDGPQKKSVKEAFVALLDRRRYIRNLVVSVEQVLEG